MQYSQLSKVQCVSGALSCCRSFTFYHLISFSLEATAECHTATYAVCDPSRARSTSLRARHRGIDALGAAATDAKKRAS